MCVTCLPQLAQQEGFEKLVLNYYDYDNSLRPGDGDAPVDMTAVQVRGEGRGRAAGGGRAIGGWVIWPLI